MTTTRVELEQRRLAWWARASNTSSAAPAIRPSRDGVGERGLVDDAAARGVDDPQRRLGVREQLGGDQPDRLGRLRQVDGEEVGAARRAPRASARGRRRAGGRGRRSRTGRRPTSCMPNACARCATSTPTRPSPTMPSVLPWSSTPSHRVRFHSPAWRSRSACGMLRACASSSAIVCSAADSTFDCGAFTTITPRRVAASTSTLSRPIPARPTTTRSVAGLEHVGGDLRRAADRRAPPRPAPRRAARRARARAARRPRARRRAWPRARCSASCSVTRTRLHRVEARRRSAEPGTLPGGLARQELGDALHAFDEVVVAEREARAGRIRARRTPRPGTIATCASLEQQLAQLERGRRRAGRASSRPSTPSNDGKQ